ncbi:oxidoreductase [Chitinimonas sp.]|uniref:oxidoreductase n=1 Tax=Chitinimonas sp. TaxID=1934313 RepID=UPI002F941500
MSKIWFITGAARGIGAEIARAALAAGDKVVATGRNQQHLQQRYAEYGEQVLSLALDVSQPAQAEAAVASALATFGRIDVLVNNAGYGLLGLFEEVAAAEIQRQFDTNFFGLLHVTRAVLPAMRRQRSGHIFNLSSIGGVYGFAGAGVYCATKFAVEGYSESLALELAPFGIHMTIVEPGFFRTDFLDTSSVRWGEQRIADYAETSAAIQHNYTAHNHQQAGDPAKLGAALVRLAGEAKPPLRYAAGSDAYAGIAEKLALRLDELQAWRTLSESTDIR